MAFWRQSLMIVTGALLIGCLGGCTPASNSPVDEEKDPYIGQGRKREREYNISGAIESYHRALEVNPRNSVAHYRLGFLYEREDRDPAAAIYHFQRYLLLRPNSEQVAVLRQRVVGCKQSLAKDVALEPVSGEMKRQLDELLANNQRLTEENQRLNEQIARLQNGFTAQTPRVSTSSEPVSQPASPTVTPTQTGVRTHTVQKGDTYYSIAKRYRVSSSALQRANPGVDPTRLKIGQHLTVPAR